MSLLERLPTELLDKISNLIATSGSKKLLGLTRASRRLHEIANPILYRKDVEESGGVVSIDHGLKTRLNSVVERCLAAGAKASPQFRVDTLRIDSNEHLETYYKPALPCLLFQTDLPDDAGLHRTGIRVENRQEAQSPASRQYPSDHVGKCVSPMAATKYTLRCHWSPLHVAAARDDVGLLKLLLDHSKRANSPGIGVCPCYYRSLRRTIGRSVSDGHITNKKEAQEFLDRKLVTRWSPLHVAICHGHLKCAEMLIDRFGLAHTEETAEELMEQAQWSGQKIRHLELTGAIPSLPQPNEFHVEDREEYSRRLTPRFDPSPLLHIAAEKYTSLGAIETVYLMLKNAGYFKDPQGIDVLDAFGDTPFAVASFSGRAQTNGAWLRERGADMNFPMTSDRRLKSIFEALCKCGRYQSAMVLMDMGVNVNSDELFRICSSYDLSYKTEEALVLINRLIDAGLDINAKSNIESHAAGYTALMATVVCPFPAATRMLIRAGADVHAINNHGKTALHLAVENCLQQSPRHNIDYFAIYLASIQLLLDHGADPNHHSQSVAPPLYAGEYGVHYSPLTWDSFDFTAKFGSGFSPMASIAPLMIRRGANPNIRLRYPIRSKVTSLALTAFYLGEFDSLDALSTHGATITRDEYLDMMRDLIDCPSSVPHGLSPVDALFRILNRPSSMLPEPGDRNYIMNAWEELLYHAVGRRPSLVHDLAKHITLTDIRGLGGKNVLHIMAGWERHHAMRPAKFKCRIERVMANLMHCGAYRMIHETDDYGKSPLQTAVDLGNTPVAIALIGYGADCHTETENHDGTMTVSPLRSAIRKDAKVCFYMVFEMLAAAVQACMLINGRKTRYFHDFVLHLGEASFDEPSQATARTAELMKKLVSLGAGVDETDGEGNTPLHVLLQLLEGSGESTISHSSGGPGNTVKRSTQSNVSSQEHTPRLFELSEEEGLRMNGQHDIYREREMDEESTHSDEPGEGISDTGGDAGMASPSTQTHPADQTREGQGDEPRVVDNRNFAWISAFLTLLMQNASLTLGNKAGKTALDYIDDFRRRPPPNCPDFYSSVIVYLNDSVKRPPFDPKLLVYFDHSIVAVQGSPALFLNARYQVCADKDRPAYTLESVWVPFW